MKRLMLVAVVMGCNYYGPDNPPPDVDAPPPTYHVTRVEVTGAQGFAAATCPAGALAAGAGCDCVSCTPADPNAFLFGCDVGVNGAAGACSPGCVHVVAVCLSSSAPGTLASPLSEPEFSGLRAAWEARRH